MPKKTTIALIQCQDAYCFFFDFSGVGHFEFLSQGQKETKVVAR